jgi:hypothetical protein
VTTPNWAVVASLFEQYAPLALAAPREPGKVLDTIQSLRQPVATFGGASSPARRSDLRAAIPFLLPGFLGLATFHSPAAVRILLLSFSNWR